MLSVQVGATLAGVERLEGQVVRLEAKVDAGFERLERRSGNLETPIEGVEREFCLPWGDRAA